MQYCSFILQEYPKMAEQSCQLSDIYNQKQVLSISKGYKTGNYKGNKVASCVEC